MKLNGNFFYRGAFHSTIALTAFEINSILNVSADPTNLTLKIQRESGFTYKLSQLFQQPAMVNNHCENCNVDPSGVANLIFNGGLIKIPPEIASYTLPNYIDPRVKTFVADTAGKSIGKVMVDAILLGFELTVGTAVDNILKAMQPYMQSNVDYSAVNSGVGPLRQYTSTIATETVTPGRVNPLTSETTPSTLV